ncbi:MAG: TRAP transporter substrate-binding protein [Sedimentisphaerales bacterium]|nr:TRAP transporter substrate-binding protein [Sedimentisphaerales bacterium]
MARKAVSLVILVLFVLGVSGCGKKSDVTVIKMGHALDTEHPVHKAMLFMADKLKEKSGGKVVLEIYPGEQLGSEREMIEQAQMGLLDMTKVSTSPLESFIPSMSVFSVPYLFRNSEHLWKVLDGHVGKKLLQAGEEKGLKGLCYFDAGSRSFYTKEKPILTPADLEGMKIRVQESNTSMQMIRELGASPTPIAWGELYTSLQQGVVDGAENNPPSFYRSSHYEVCKHYSLDEHTMVPDIVLMSLKSWNKLPADVQKMVQEVADESVVYQKQLWKEDTKKALDAVQAQGVKVYNPDKAAFRQKVKKMHESYNGTEVGKYMQEIEQVQ